MPNIFIEWLNRYKYNKKDENCIIYNGYVVVIVEHV